jgi:hypothetical protein
MPTRKKKSKKTGRPSLKRPGKRIRPWSFIKGRYTCDKCKSVFKSYPSVIRHLDSSVCVNKRDLVVEVENSKKWLSHMKVCTVCHKLVENIYWRQHCRLARHSETDFVDQGVYNFLNFVKGMGYSLPAPIIPNVKSLPPKEVGNKIADIIVSAQHN